MLTIEDGSATLYVDGVDQGTVKASAIDTSEGRELIVGQIAGFDEVATYDTVLTDSQVLAHYNAATQ